MGCNIGPKTIQKAKDDLGHIIDIYRKTIAETFLKEDPLKISLKLTFKGKDNGSVGIKTDIDFVTERVKDDLESQVNEDQGELFTIPRPKQETQGLNPAPEPEPEHIYPYLPEEWPSALAWLVGIDEDTESPVMVGKCAYCGRVVMSTDLYEMENNDVACLPCIRDDELEVSEDEREQTERAWKEIREASVNPANNIGDEDRQAAKPARSTWESQE